MGGVIAVLGYLEQREVIHGDLGPTSIMLFGGSQVMLLNFGLSLQLIKDPMS